MFRKDHACYGKHEGLKGLTPWACKVATADHCLAACLLRIYWLSQRTDAASWTSGFC